MNWLQQPQTHTQALRLALLSAGLPHAYDRELISEDQCDPGIIVLVDGDIYDVRDIDNPSLDNWRCTL